MAKDNTKHIKVYNKKKTKRNYERVADVRDLCRVIQKHGSRVAFSYFGEGRRLQDITYRELYRMILRISAGLTTMGLSKKRVAILGETSVEWVACYLSVLATGSVVIPLDKELEISVIDGFMESVDANALVYSASFNGKFANTVSDHSSLSLFIPMEPNEAELALGEKVVAIEDLYAKGAELVKAGYTIPDV